MAFQSLTDYNDNINHGYFLIGDGEHTNVIFLLRSPSDIMVNAMHYINTSEYSGYVDCNGKGCAVCGCGRNIPVQMRCFLPVYNMDTNQVEFWDRSKYWVNKNMPQLFERYSNLSEFIFTISREGSGRDDTRYHINVAYRNSFKSYDQILQENNISFPQAYTTMCKSFSNAQLNEMLNPSEASNSGSGVDDGYTPKPRQAYQYDDKSFVNIPDYSPSADDAAKLGGFHVSNDASNSIPDIPVAAVEPAAPVPETPAVPASDSVDNASDDDEVTF